MSNEITVKIKGNTKEICKILEEKGFNVKEKFFLDDTYFVPKDIDLDNMNPRDILSKAILIRDITELIPPRKVKKLTFKRKEIDEHGNILSQNKTDCTILDVEEGKKFIEAIGYTELMNIKEYDVQYEKDDFEVSVKHIEDSEDLIEVELIEDNEKFNTIDKLKNKIKELEIPIDDSNYFVKKAEIHLKKILNNRNKEWDLGG